MTLKKEFDNQTLKIVYVPIDSLTSPDYNPRFWTEEATCELKDSILRHGLVDPLLVNLAPNRKGIIIGGNFRWEVSKQLGFTEVPVIYIDIPDVEREKELCLRLNANTGDWDYEMLKSFDVDFLLDIGFNHDEMTAIWDATMEIEDDNFKVEKELQVAKNTDVKIGNMFALGRHRLICLDSTDPISVQEFLNGIKVDVINCDPPYNINLDYNGGIGGKRNYGGTTNDKKSEKDYRLFVKKLIDNGLNVANKDCHVFFWLDEKYVGMMQELYREAGLDQKRLCLWLKDNQNPTPQIAFNKISEFCLYGVRGKPYLSDKVKNLNEVLNKEVSTGNRLIDDVLDLLNIWLVKRLPGNELEHPTQKPPTLYEKALRRCSKPGDIILDLTAGSGSILVACEQLKRTAYLSEVEPIFCQLILNRYEKLTGNKPTKLN
ncbi:MAG: DNA modification methylase [Patescibacteria group bacterium]|nr:DNA modification methylase [Patescibacteria group bacterium]